MKKLDIAVLCGPENGSPRVLAETLEQFVKDSGNNSELFYQVKAFNRLYDHKTVGRNWFIWQLYKLKNLFKDKALLSELKSKDAIIICDWTPSGFYTETYNIEKLRQILGEVPILYYAVQYMGNSPSIMEKLRSGNHALQERYDWHLTVSSVTELRGTPAPPWSQIGMNLKSTGLKPAPKEEFFAIVDFVREGFEQHRELQIQALEELGIKYIALEKSYTLSEIREIYKKATLYFIQFHEAYGMPIAECLACGSYVLTPDSAWPMAWRLDEKLENHGPGTLPECFVVYDSLEDLKSRLEKIREEFHVEKTPQKVFDVFMKNYNTYYEGNMDSFKEVLEMIRTKKIHG